MKFLLFLLICSFGFSVSLGINEISHSKNGKTTLKEPLNGPIDSLWKQALEYIRALLKKYEPFQVPDMPVQTITGDGISLTAKFDRVMISKAENFTIDKIDNHAFGLWAKFQVTEPSMHIDGYYTITGNVKGKAVKGNGQFSIELENLITGGYVKVAFKGLYLQMSQFDMYYTVENLKFNETGLEVEGMTHEQLESLFQNSFLEYFQENEKYVCTQISAYVMEQANKIMYKKSLKGLLEWLKDFIDGKIIPPQ